MKTTLLALLALTLLIGAHAPAKPLQGSQPNIVFVLTDDQGMGDLSCMGNPYLQTPHIDAFYQKAVRLSDYHVSPTCSPTRAALMSGRHPLEVGVSHTILQRERLAPDVVTMPQALQKAGYQTGLFGKWHLGDEEKYLPQNRGFHEVLMHGAGGIGQYGLGDFEPNSHTKYFDPVLLHNETVVQGAGFCTDVFFEAGLAWIHKQIDEKKPYLAYLSLNAPHGPMYAPEADKKRLLDMGFDKETAARYGMIENIDTNFGTLMARLEEWNALDNTLVIFMTDNGMSMRPPKLKGKPVEKYNANLFGGKNSPHEGGTRVPSFWYWKDRIQGGRDITALTAHLDLYRTFCDLAGTPIPESKLPPRGRSLIPLFEDAKSEWPDRHLFVHKARWDDGRKSKLTMEQSKHKGSAIRTTRWRLIDGAKLYDITADPSQSTDVAAAHPEVVAELLRAYDDWWTTIPPFLEVNAGLETTKSGEYHLQRLHQNQAKPLKKFVPQTRR